MQTQELARSHRILLVPLCHSALALDWGSAAYEQTSVFVVLKILCPGEGWPLLRRRVQSCRKA